MDFVNWPEFGNVRSFFPMIVFSFFFASGWWKLKEITLFYVVHKFQAKAMTDHHLYLISHPMCNLAKILRTEYKIKSQSTWSLSTAWIRSWPWRRWSFPGAGCRGLASSAAGSCPGWGTPLVLPTIRHIVRPIVANNCYLVAYVAN